MKSIIIISFILFMPLFVVAQFEKSKTITGGAASITNTFVRGFNSTSTVINIGHAFAMSDGFFLGTDFTFAHLRGNSAFGLSPFLRKYFTYSEKGGVYGQLKGGFVTGGGTEGFINPSIGYSVLAGSNVLIDIDLGYQRFFESSANIVGLTFGIRALLGEAEAEEG